MRLRRNLPERASWRRWYDPQPHSWRAPHLVLGMGAAGAVAVFLAASGANLDTGGWRGAAVALAGAVVTFGLVAKISAA